MVAFLVEGLGVVNWVEIFPKGIIPASLSMVQIPAEPRLESIEAVHGMGDRR